MQRIGVQPNFGKTLISIMGVQGGAVSKGAFATFMTNKVSGAASALSGDGWESEQVK